MEINTVGGFCSILKGLESGRTEVLAQDEIFKKYVIEEVLMSCNISSPPFVVLTIAQREFAKQKLLTTNELQSALEFLDSDTQMVFRIYPESWVAKSEEGGTFQIEPSC